jgi:hypothetical protein
MAEGAVRIEPPNRGPEIGAAPISGTVAAGPGVLERWLAAVLLAVLLLAAGRNALSIAREVAAAPRLPQWDMARRGIEGIELAEALRRGDIAELLWRINETSVWPPVFPLVEAPVFLVFGYDYTVPRLLVTVLYALCVPAIYWAGRHLDRRHGGLVGLLAAGFLCASPVFQLYAGLVMLEVPGALLLILCLGAYARALESADPGRWRLAWCLATLLFFCKFNYGLMWLAPLLLIEAWRVFGSWRAVAERLRSRLRSFDTRRPWNSFVLLYAAAAAAALTAGGFAVEIAGVKVRLSSVGGPVYHLYVLWVLRWLLRPRRHLGRFRRWLATLEPRHRQLVCWVALPIALWMLIPPHTRDFFDFVQNRSSGMAFLSWDNLLFYPRVWTRDFAPTRAWGAALLVLGALPCFVLPRLVLRHRILALTLVGGAGAIFVHPYKLPRFAFTVAPLVWLSAALVLAHLLAALSALAGRRRARPLALALAGAVMAAALAGGVDMQRFQRGYNHRTVPRAVEKVIHAAYRATSAPGGTVILGTWNLLSPWLVEWELRRRHPELDPARFPATLRQLDRVRAEQICDDLAFARVVALDPLPAQRTRPAVRGFAEEIAPLEPVYAALAEAPCYRLESEIALPRAGYRLRVYQRRP